MPVPRTFPSSLSGIFHHLPYDGVLIVGLRLKFLAVGKAILEVDLGSFTIDLRQTVRHEFWQDGLIPEEEGSITFATSFMADLVAMV